MKELGFNHYFDITFFSCKLGFKKDTPQFWNAVKLRFPDTDPSSIVFWDDDEKNVLEAKKYGIHARNYKEFEDFKLQMHELIEGKQHLPQN